MSAAGIVLLAGTLARHGVATAVALPATRAERMRVRAEVEMLVPETAPAADRANSEDEEREVLRRLKAFGYL